MGAIGGGCTTNSHSFSLIKNKGGNRIQESGLAANIKGDKYVGFQGAGRKAKTWSFTLRSPSPLHSPHVCLYPIPRCLPTQKKEHFVHDQVNSTMADTRDKSRCHGGRGEGRREGSKGFRCGGGVEGVQARGEGLKRLWAGGREGGET